jgi:hypothetical protein
LGFALAALERPLGFEFGGGGFAACFGHAIEKMWRI